MTKYISTKSLHKNTGDIVVEIQSHQMLGSDANHDAFDTA